MAVEVAGKRLQTRAILGRLGHVGGKRALHARTTARALLDLRLMLCHFNASWRYVEYLPSYMPLGSHCLQLCLAVWARIVPMKDDMVRFRHLHQGSSLASTLPPTRPLTRAAQTLAFAFLQTIAARWLAAIVTIFRQLTLQFLNQRLLRSHLLLQLLNQCLLPKNLLTQRLNYRKALLIQLLKMLSPCFRGFAHTPYSIAANIRFAIAFCSPYACSSPFYP